MKLLKEIIIEKERVIIIKITCESRFGIGYIYLKNPNYTNSICNAVSKEIEKHLDGVKPEIPVERGNKAIEARVKGLGINDKTYLEELDGEIIEEEYLNDKDKDGYIFGIELHISKDQLMQNIKEQVYKIYMIDYQQQENMLLTLSDEDKVFDKNNILYAANGNKDTYYIVSVLENTVYIRGLLTRRLDLYQVDYLKEPYFILD
jgi:hypothetical protein